MVHAVGGRARGIPEDLVAGTAVGGPVVEHDRLGHRAGHGQPGRGDGDRLPAGPPVEPPEVGTGAAGLGEQDVVSIVADVAEGCEPVFLDLTEAGAGQVVPLDVFVVEPGTDNGTRYRVDTSTPVGLRITPEDTKGVHYVGYVCTADGSFPETDLLKEIHGGLAGGTLRRTDPAAGPVFWFERYEIR